MKFVSKALKTVSVTVILHHKSSVPLCVFPITEKLTDGKNLVTWQISEQTSEKQPVLGAEEELSKQS